MTQKYRHYSTGKYYKPIHKFLLGLYSFGLFLKTKTVKDKFVPIVCILAPAITFVISANSKMLFGDYEFAEELIILNGGLTFLGLLLISKKATSETRF